ncbi:MAG TPA: PAS domain-containing sensor histidine kinase, partial [Bacteroidia bacterium]|nr:PAS domain-containing sensor histidine kinase [Bacteroidia bacterium]
SNITDKKRFEILISENEKKYRNIIQSSNDLIQSVDISGKFEFVNTSWLNTLEYTAEEIHQLNIFDIVDESDHDLCSALFRDISNGIKLERITTILKTKSGKKITVEGNSVPMYKDGVVIGAQTFFRDVSDRVAAEEELVRKMNDLKKSNNELDKFVYSVSHDLRAPLSSMLGIIDLAKDDTTEEIMQEHLHMLQNNINKLDGFITDILDYSRNARSDIKRSEFNLRELVEEISQNLKYMGGSNRKVDIRIQSNGLDTIVSDRSRMSIIFNNLISNAIRYQNTKIENPFVDIELNLSDTETGIIVRDNGIGISSELQDKIFDMFFRVSENSVGSGLGLYIVKEAITKLSGEIYIESEPGIGSAFKIKIPQ